MSHRDDYVNNTRVKQELMLSHMNDSRVVVKFVKDRIVLKQEISLTQAINFDFVLLHIRNTTKNYDHVNFKIKRVDSVVEITLDGSYSFDVFCDIWKGLDSYFKEFDV